MRRSLDAGSPDASSETHPPPPGDSAEKRIIDLELRYMRLERALEELSQVVAAQHQVIEALTLEAKRRRQAIDDDSGPPVRDERPPHY